MATATSHNKKSSSVKRILSEARELSTDQSDLYTAAPLEDNIFEWHFTLRGPANTEFSDGLYHGRIILPAEYPMRPPDLMLLTPNGRWELNKKICLTFTGFHEEMWQPAWGIRTALLGLQTFMTAKAEAAVGIGALDYPVEKRKALAKESRQWRCEVCGAKTLDMLPDPDPQNNKDRVKEERLPDGLQVDLTAKSHKEPPTSQSTSTAADTSSAPAPTSSSSLSTTSERPPEPLPASNASTVAAPADTASSSTATTQLQHGHTAITPPVRLSSFASAIPPRPPSSAVATANRPPQRTVSATEQKLTLIDNCIKALGILVALLVVKRLV